MASGPSARLATGVVRRHSGPRIVITQVIVPRISRGRSDYMQLGQTATATDYEGAYSRLRNQGRAILAAHRHRGELGGHVARSHRPVGKSNVDSECWRGSQRD